MQVLRFWRRQPLILIALAIVCVSPGGSPLHDAVSRVPAADVALALPPWYVVFSPFCRLLDTLSLLTVRQHVAFLVSVLVAALVFGALAGARGTRSPGRRAVTSLFAALLTLVGLLALYAVGALAPRPMAAVRFSDPDLLAVDFHSHTDHSWDVRRGWDAARNRRWHAAAGFDVAYVTDHRSFAGAQAALAANPRVAGEGLVLLSGIETIADGVHVCVLGAVAADSAIYRGGQLDTLAFVARHRDDAVPPVSVLTIPARLDAPPLHGARIAAVELSDAAPRGLQFGAAHRARLLQLADAHGLAVVAGSNNHGWGRTAVAWNVMRIPGWRAMTPAALDVAIRAALLADGPAAVRVIERRSYVGATWDRVALAAPVVGIGALTRLTWPERVSWLGWLVGGSLLVSRWRRRARGREAARVAST